MEQEIYVDILVFLNTVINFFLLLITAALAGREKKSGPDFDSGVSRWNLCLDFAAASVERPGSDLDSYCSGGSYDCGRISFPFSAHLFISVWVAVSRRFFVCRADGGYMASFFAAGHALWKRRRLFPYPGDDIGAGRINCLRSRVAVYPPSADPAGRKGLGTGPNWNRRKTGFPAGRSRYRKPTVRSFQRATGSSLPLPIGKGAAFRTVDRVF